jgi:hypothetical protein
MTTIALMALNGFATERAFMGFDTETQKMYAVVVGDSPIRAEVSYTQSRTDGYIGDNTTFAYQPAEVWSEANLSPMDPDRATDLPDGAVNVITAHINIFDANDQYLYTMTVNDTLQASVNGADGAYQYVNNDVCAWNMPDSIRINTAYCGWVCHGSWTVPIVCEDPGYNPDLLEVSVTNGCNPAETHCNDATCPRIDWSVFRWFKRVLPGCHLFLTMTYCNATPGCVCVWRSDFRLPVEMLGFSANAGDGRVTLNWATATEDNTQKFIVTRSDSRDGAPHTVGSVDAAGNSSTRQNYTWTDTDVVNGHTYYYKLHVQDVNGTHVYNDNNGAIIVSATPGAGIPQEYSLNNYPNPFNSQTTFSFTIPFDGHVSLKVYDLLGREVATVMNKNLTANSYSVNWSAEGLATGVYMYTLKSGQFAQTRKLLYVK